MTEQTPQSWGPPPTSPPQPGSGPLEPQPPKPSLWQRIARHKLLTVAVVVVVLAGGSAVAYSALREDSGVAACKAMAARANSTTTNTEFTAKDYQHTRKLFADSGDAAIRTNGTKLIDAAWQASKTTDDNAFGMLALVGSMTDAYTGLTGACASHGVTLPPLSSIADSSSPPSSAGALPPPASDSSAFPDEGVTSTTQPEVAHKRVGETATLIDADSNEELERVVIDRVKFASGDEFNKPERGLWLGVHVKTRALADGQSSLWGDIYVIERGHHYEADGCCPEGFSPSLDYVDLNAGETAEGWLVFDVPARHGEVVLKNSSDDSKIGTWTF
jgi:hypothetical protein